MPDKPELMQMMSQLIETPSVSCTNPDIDMSNQPVIHLLANWLSELNFKVEIIPVSDGKSNLIATRGSGDGGLVLAGHTDTVPYDENRWQHNPFKLTEANHRLYGLGTSDMKAFLALAIEAALMFKAEDYKQPLIILATSDEETTMEGAKTLVEISKPRARYAIIGEPTGMKPIRMHKGILMEAIRITGLAGHSSDPRLGHNAMEAMHTVITELMQWRNELQQQYKNPLFEVPVPTMNLGHIHGGDNPNRICGSCELHIDIRPLPGMQLDELRYQLNQRLSRVIPENGFKLETFPLFSGIPAMETDSTSELVKAAEKLTGQTSGSVAFGTEAPFLTQLGIETLILGPGNIDQAHQPDEYLELNRIQPTLDLLHKFIYQFCIS
ncbi:MAG: acetylornithine deacetylase [Gammaproteobacteria bacterium]|nr:acetylornithine deacetylase [Gammaproteobacteria bacterium]MCW8910970.1 acetylornithine deacetylase [Gammaproteobacteria bacterium]MCW9005723.1 acetylornithine deacetylase [Gammaproteobacteria bacterium]